MTVKDVINHTEPQTKIVIACFEKIIPFDRDDAICQDAFNNYLVDKLVIIDDNTIEINLKIAPVKN